MENTITKNIQEIISKYKINFEQVDKEERYKWEALGCYKRNWNIKAENFAEMYAAAFAESSSSLRAAMYWPYKMAITFAEKEPEKVRELFKMLYDESLPFDERYMDFRTAFDRFYKPQKLNHYQDLHAISVYLSFEYPEKYFIYKYKVTKNFSKQIGYAINLDKVQSEGEKLNSYFTLCGMVLAEIKKDTGLQKLSSGRLNENCYHDNEFHLLTQDIIYFGSKKDLSVDDWWPSLEEFDPELSKEDWKKYILEIERPNHPSPMRMLKAMMELGGEASCKKLSQVYGGDPSAYVGCSVNLGRRVKNYFDLPACMDGEQERFFPFPFLGKYILED